MNSPLVKTAVHGADPNWGRVAMAIGKCSDDTDIDQERVRIRFGDAEVYPTPVDDADLGRAGGLPPRRRGPHRRRPGHRGRGRGRVYGCDLSDGYVRINADYTT